MDKINFYDKLTNQPKSINPNYALHGIKVPFRMLMAAPSGSGKTNALCQLIYHMDKTFHEIIICVKSADEPLYQMLDDRLKNIVFFEGGEVPNISDYSMKDPRTNKLKRIDKLQRLIVFDDLITDKKANQMAKEYYIKCRKLGFSAIYCGQSYFQIPKMVRDNCQYFIIGRNLLKKDLKMILSCFPTELSIDEFTNIYTELTKEPLDVLLIDIESRIIRPNIIGEPIKL